MTSSERHLIPLLAAAAVIIFLHQALDIFTSASLDLAASSPGAGLVAALWSRAPALISADVCLVAAAQLASWTRVLRALSLLHLMAGAGALALLPVFLSGAGHIAPGVAGAELTSFRITVTRVLLGLLMAGIGAGITGLGLASQVRTAAATAP